MWGTTDDVGEAVFEGLVPEERLRLLALPTAEGQGAAWTMTFKLPVRGEAVQDVELPPGWILSGRVLDAATGRPLAGARVASFWQFVGAVETDPEGRFALPGVTAKWDEAVHVVAEGYAREVVPVQGVRSLDVALHVAGRVVGRVVDASGDPVAGALLRAIGAETSTPQQAYSFSAGRSAADGTFALGGLERHRAHTLVVKAIGHAKTLVDFDLTEGANVLELGDVRLAASCAVRGSVLDPEGNPAPRVQVELKGWNEDRGDRREGQARPVTLFYGTRETRNTDDLGRFVFADVAPGTYTLKLTGGDQATGPVEVIVDADAPTEEIVLRRVAVREVLVTIRDPDGQVVPGATLRVREGLMVLQILSAGPDGTARLLLPRRSLTLLAWVPDDDTRESVGPLAIGPEETEISVVIRRVRVFRAKLVGPEGNPLPLAILDIQAGENSHRRFTNGDGDFGLQVESDEQRLSIYFRGAFQEAGPRGRPYTLPLAAEVHDISPGDTGVVVHARAVPQDRTASVRLLDPDGNPLAGVEVTPYPAMKGAPSMTRATDAEGRVRFQGLPALPLMFYPSIQPSADRPWLRPEMERRMVDDGEVVLRMRRGRRIEGRVIVPDGVPFGRVYVHARDPVNDGYRASAKLDDVGRFVLIVDPNQGPSRLRIQHYDDRGEKTEAVVEDVEAGRTDLVITLAPEG
jgi:protocatechuate 3,4-dioxygenase beta subunit